MVITWLDKLKMRMLIYRQLHRMPNLKDALRIFINPIDVVRDVEFTYLIKFINKNNIVVNNILDVSSPFVMSYLLSVKSNVTKTDINPYENKMIKESDKLRFKLEDATRLSFKDNSFDIVYSISVIEHIYQKYTDAVQEMIRVTKPGGLIYVTFPVAGQHAEEWLDYKMYPEQYVKSGSAFFQYRFDKNDIDRLLEKLDNVKLLDLSIYWEKSDGGYDKVMNLVKDRPLLKHVNTLRNGFTNLYYNFKLLEGKPGNFNNTKSFGNASLVFEKLSELNREKNDL